jgi:hypothetical protein
VWICCAAGVVCACTSDCVHTAKLFPVLGIRAGQSRIPGHAYRFSPHGPARIFCHTERPQQGFPYHHFAHPQTYCSSLSKHFSFIMSSNSSSGYRGRGGGYRGTPGRGDRGRGRGLGRGNAPPFDRATIPRGICQFYWSTGACDRGFDCTFKHEAKLQVAASSSATPPADYTPDFFSLEGLAMNNGSVVDSQHTLRPSEAHNHLRPYLFDNFVFRDTTNIEGFSRIFASVSSRNRSWVSLTLCPHNNDAYVIAYVI